MDPRALFLTLVAVAAGFSGCLGDDDASTDDTNAAAGDDMLLAGNITTDTSNGNLQATAATPVRSFNNGGDFLHPISQPDNLTGIVLELEWTASQTSTGDLSLWVQPANAGSIPPADPTNVVFRPAPVAQADGGSPLRLVVPADLIADGDYELVIRAAGPAGAAYDQDFALHTTSFIGLDFDAEYSALGSDDDADADQ